jgi:L-threonylcarbamoyladenylate synthase
MTVILKISDSAIEQAADIIRRGGLVAFPTETVYGLGANALDAAAVARIFEAKGRPPNNPIIVHVTDVSQVPQVVDLRGLTPPGSPELIAKLADRFWPGPLTLVLPKHADVPDIVTAGGPTVAVRVPAHPIAHALLEAVQLPIAAPSANRSSEISPTTAEHVRKALDGRVDMILDGGPCPGGLESTVLDVTSDPPRLLRPGLITIGELESIVGAIHRFARTDQSQPLASPGLLDRHYAPQARLEVADDDGRTRVIELARNDESIGWLTWPDVPPVANVTRIDLPREPIGFAAGLYAALHVLDAVGVRRIVVAKLPEGDDWLAIRDRFNRAKN